MQLHRLATSSCQLVLWFAVVCGAVVCGAVVMWCDGAVWCVVLWCVVLWCGVVWCVVLCCAVMCCAVLCGCAHGLVRCFLLALLRVDFLKEWGCMLPKLSYKIALPVHLLRQVCFCLFFVFFLFVFFL